MKKQLLLLVMLLLPMMAVADSIHEEDLAGIWILESSEGEFAREKEMIASKITFYTVEQCWNGRIGKYEGVNVFSYIYDFILYNSNGGLRLHITLHNTYHNLRYIVKYIDSNQMILQTYDKKGTLVYKRENSSSNISELKPDKGNDQMYSIKGEMISDTSGKDVVIKNGKKYIVK